MSKFINQKGITEQWEYNFFEPQKKDKVKQFPTILIQQEKQEPDQSYNPLFVKVQSKREAKCVLAWRIVFVILFVFLLIPHDIYAPNFQPFDFRWGFWANRIQSHSVDIKSLTNYTISLENCNLFLKPSAGTSLQFEISSNYATHFETNSTYLEVKDKQMNNIDCDVYMKTPTSQYSLLPNLYVLFNGTKSGLELANQDFTQLNNIKFQPNANFSITGKTGSVSLSHIHSQKFRMKYESVYANLQDINAPLVRVIARVGYLNAELSKNYTYAELSVSQPYGSICLTGPKAHEKSNANCPTESQRKQPIQVAPSGQILDDNDCFVEARLCRDQSADCSNLTASPSQSQNWEVSLDDGNVHISYFKQLQQDVDFTPDDKNKTSNKN